MNSLFTLTRKQKTVFMAYICYLKNAFFRSKCKPRHSEKPTLDTCGRQ